MGLDLVEMVIHIEEEFEVTIADEEAEKMTTPREVIDYLMRKPKIGERRSRNSVADTVWQIIEYETSVKREDFNEDSRFIEDMGLN